MWRVTITAFEAQESKYKQIIRNVADNEEKYKTYLSKLEEARIHDELDRQKMTNVSVLEPASIPIIPNNLPLPLVVYVLISVVVWNCRQHRSCFFHGNHESRHEYSDPGRKAS